MSASSEGLHLAKHEPPQLTRVTLSRKAGWTLPPNTMKVDRSTPYGNPFKLGDNVDGFPLETIEEVVDAYRQWAKGRIHLPNWQKLKGRNLACWCKPGEPCHADVLMTLVNPPAKKAPQNRKEGKP